MASGLRGGSALLARSGMVPAAEERPAEPTAWPEKTMNKDLP